MVPNSTRNGIFLSQKKFTGITKMSGNIGDAVKFGKLAVFQKIILQNILFIIPEKGSLGDFLFTKRYRFFRI